MIFFDHNLHYLDPGTGAFLFQLLAAAFVSLGIYSRKIIEFIKVKFFRKNKSN